ncbi:hypothetical protein BJ138DRAFT_1107266 [Hygrophoropsis aurantiaca]|uniref:Uncharacterized protein n=1 Tax=Hygrophoropsis aurantiaca TaxID=72124 RepID=A0ACB7ZT87_9AGAM|nr:hypothetical protein BJ138DRAFT_1107266 [Hygrophoropsis aurantiaca]
MSRQGMMKGRDWNYRHQPSEREIGNLRLRRVGDRNVWMVCAQPVVDLYSEPAGGLFSGVGGLYSAPADDLYMGPVDLAACESDWMCCNCVCFMDDGGGAEDSARSFPLGSPQLEAEPEPAWCSAGIEGRRRNRVRIPNSMATVRSSEKCGSASASSVEDPHQEIVSIRSSCVHLPTGCKPIVVPIPTGTSAPFGLPCVPLLLGFEMLRIEVDADVAVEVAESCREMGGLRPFADLETRKGNGVNPG